MTAIDPQAFAKLCADGHTPDVIDVRTPVEYLEVHVEIARNVPLDRLDVTIGLSHLLSATETIGERRSSSGSGQ